MVEPHRYSQELAMATELVALLIVGALTATNLLVSTVAMTLGTFVATSPHRAAKIWGSQRLHNLAPQRRAAFISWYRVFGMLLFLAGLLCVVDSIVFSNYHD